MSKNPPLITDIQRFSLHDGPGIRTTIFFKGCNLACDWCHNPETIQAKPELMHYTEKCISCGECLKVCPTRACHLDKAQIVIARELCLKCLKCAAVCPSGALTGVGKQMSVEEIMDEIRQDRIYYVFSGGGVTISGGEAMCQAEFLKQILICCNSEGIKTALETNLHYPYEILQPLLEYLDLLMFDIKTSSPELHRQHTGHSNRQILANLAHLSSIPLPKIVRTPLVPGVNDNPEEISAIADLIANQPGLMYYELLNYNPLGHGKRTALGWKSQSDLDQRRPLPAARLEQLRQAAKRSNLEVRIS